VDLLNDEHPAAMLHVYIDGCNTVEEITGQNELEASNDASREAIEHPSLEDLERTNDFKTPRKVRLMPGFVDATYTYEIFTFGHIELLDLSGLQSIGGKPTPSQRAVCQMFDGWDMIKENFELIWLTMMAHEEKTKNDQSGIRAQLQESIDYLNGIGAKARLLSAKIGRYPKAEADGDPMLWEALSELSNEFKMIKTAVESRANYAKETKDQLEKQGIEIRKMDQNMTKMYTHYKGHLGSSNMRLIEVERQLSTLRNA
jgi:hypothetical protein